MGGGLRRKRGGDVFDMSDSEDEAEERRRKKQMQFKQMTKALITDDRIGQIGMFIHQSCVQSADNNTQPKTPSSLPSSTRSRITWKIQSMISSILRK